jgi:LmbE family N-acetylglucosaminyl deacetylase
VTTLFVSPHFDDVVLSCVAHVIDARRVGRVVVATAFGAGQADRKREDARALALLGAEQVVLPFADAPDRLDVAPGFASLLLTRYPGEAEDRAALVETLRGMIETEAISRIFLPLGVGGHVDHRIVHDVHDLGQTALDVWFYEDQPYARMRGALAARMAEIGAYPEEDGRRVPFATVTAREARDSALGVFGPLIEASSDPRQSRAEVGVLAEVVAAAGSSPPPTAPREGPGRVGKLTSQLLPAVPELAERALRCYTSQLPTLFPSPAGVRAFMASRKIERSWRKRRPNR